MDNKTRVSGSPPTPIGADLRTEHKMRGSNVNLEAKKNGEKVGYFVFDFVLFFFFYFFLGRKQQVHPSNSIY